MWFLTFVLLVVLVVVYIQLKRRVARLESHADHAETDPIRRLRLLERRVQAVEEVMYEGRGGAATSAPPAAAGAAPSEAGAQPPALSAHREEPPEEAGEALEPVTISDRRGQPDQILRTLSSPSSLRRSSKASQAVDRGLEQVPREPSALQQRWKRLERQLIENWTGILGSAVLVAGITFIGAYGGLRLSPFYRSLMIAGAAAALLAGSLFLDRRANWKALSQWLRSSAAAVFLFACFASGAIPGLRWVTTFELALPILLLGVSTNLYVAYAARKQAFASLHVVLSLVPLTLVPQSDLTLVIATLVAAAGLAFAFRTRWDLHSLITLLAFAIFHAAWYDRVFATALNSESRAVGAVSALLVGGLAALTHYRGMYAAMRVQTLPFVVHLASWTLVAAALLVYPGNTPLRGASLIAAAVAVFILARRGRTLGVRWVYLTDTLVGQALALIGVVSFYPFVFHWLLVPAVVFLQTALYLKIAIDEHDELLERVGIRLLHLAGATLVVAGLIAFGTDPGIRNQHAVILLVGVLLGTVIHLYLLRVRGAAFDSLSLHLASGPAEPSSISVLGSGMGALAAVALINLFESRWMAPAGFVASLLFVVLARRWTSVGLTVAAWAALVMAHLLSWRFLYSQHPVPAVIQLSYYLVPLTLAGAAAIVYTGAEEVGRFLRHTAIYLVGLTLALAAYTILQPVSSLVPGVVWLMLSLVALEVANRVRRDHVAPVLHLGYVYIACFGGAYPLVVLQTQAYLGPLPVRVLIEAFALAVGGYWWLYRPKTDLAAQRTWRAVHPLLLELMLGFLAVVTAVEVAAQWRPVAWALLALVTVARPLGGALDARLRFYSLLFFWASVLDLVVVTSGLATPSPVWYEHPRFTGALAIALQLVYLAFGSPRLNLAELHFPTGLTALSRWCRGIAARQPMWLYYPFFVGGAVFLYWRFDPAFLTILWAAEAFVVFVLSLVIREGHFRYMALAGFAASLIRLLVHDMTQANLGLKGVVFVGVGLLMLGMNSLYNKYKGRFA